MFKGWSWQRWVGKLLPFVIGLAGLLWKFLGIEPEPGWWVVVVAFLTGFIQWLLGKYPEE